MSRLFAAILTAALLFAAVPAFAQEPTEEPVAEPTEEPAIVACENPDGLEVITRDGLSTDIATPSFLVGNEVETKEFLVDLAATTTSATATVLAGLTWGIALNDYDLEAYSAASGGLSDNYQPIDPAEESISLTKVKHCEVITASAVDFLAPIVADTMALEFTVSKIVDPGPTAPVTPVTQAAPAVETAPIAALLAQ